MLYCVIQSMNGGSKDLTGGTAMIYTALTKKAMKVAYEAHHGQTDRSGTPYIFHPFHVAEQMDDELSVCTALLHDVIEDTEITFEDLTGEFPEEVVAVSYTHLDVYKRQVVGLRGNAGQANYAASKAGIIGLTKSVAKELASRGITVNAIAPGFIKTDMTDVLSDKVKENIAASIPMGSMGTTEDVAKAAAFLASDGARYITGQVLRVEMCIRDSLYERLGFTQLGVIPKGFRMKDGHYEDICPYYHEL